MGKKFYKTVEVTQYQSSLLLFTSFCIWLIESKIQTAANDKIKLFVALMKAQALDKEAITFLS